MAVEKLLERLEMVRAVGEHRWLAKCPAHDDKKPSLSIRERDDGKFSVICFAGCGGIDIMTSVGLTLSDFYPERDGYSKSEKPNHWHAAKIAMQSLMSDLFVLCVISEDMAKGKELNEERKNRIWEINSKIKSTLGLIGARQN